MIPRKQPSALAVIGAVIGLLLIIALSIVATPLVALLVGMLIGQILEWFTGDYVVTAFNIVGFNGVQDGDLPKVFGLLAVITLLLRVGASNARTTQKGDE